MRTHGLKHGDVEFRKRVEPDLLAHVITIKSYWVAEFHLAYNLTYSILPGAGENTPIAPGTFFVYPCSNDR